LRPEFHTFTLVNIDYAGCQVGREGNRFGFAAMQMRGEKFY
jgi:hypothetical protein